MCDIFILIRVIRGTKYFLHIHKNLEINSFMFQQILHTLILISIIFSFYVIFFKKNRIKEVSPFNTIVKPVALQMDWIRTTRDVSTFFTLTYNNRFVGPAMGSMVVGNQMNAFHMWLIWADTNYKNAKKYKKKMRKNIYLSQ